MKEQTGLSVYFCNQNSRIYDGIIFDFYYSFTKKDRFSGLFYLANKKALLLAGLLKLYEFKYPLKTELV